MTYHDNLDRPHVIRPREWRVGSWRLRLEWRSSKAPFGRFGGGWQWAVGVECGGTSAVLSLLVLTVRLDRLARTTPPAVALLLVVLMLPGCAWLQEQTRGRGPILPGNQYEEAQADRWQFGRDPDTDPRLNPGGHGTHPRRW